MTDAPPPHGPSSEVESVIITEKLDSRPSRLPDHAAEADALGRLARQLAERPQDLLQHLTDLIVEMDMADSAGVSIWEKAAGRFRWDALSGAWAEFKGGTMPFDASPCGQVISNDRMLLFEHPERVFPDAKVDPLIQEILLVPLRVDGRPIGTLWINAHSAERKFDSEDARLLTRLADFASAGIQARTRADEALHESEERLRQFGEASQDVLWIRDAETFQWTYLTPAFETIYGLPREEALSGDNFGSWLELIVPEDREHAAEFIGRVGQGENVTFEYRVQRPIDGEIRWLRDTDFPIRDASGALLIGGIGRDITEEKLAQKRLEQSEERLQSAVEVVRLGLWDWDIRTHEVYWSNEHFRMAGYAVGEVTPSYEAWASRLHPDDRVATEATLQRAMDEQKDYVCEFRNLHPDGSVHWHSARGRFSYDDRGQAVRMVGAMTDVTEARRWEQRQELLLAELQHRVRNLIGMIRSVAKGTAKGYHTVEDYVDHFAGRLQAMGRTQGVLTRWPGATVDLEDLVREELLVHAASEVLLSIEGPEVRLSPKAAEVLTLAVHELATNSVKYGVLGETGPLAIRWSEFARDNQPWVRFCWREAVRYPATESRKQGFGTELIEQRVPYELQGEGSLQITLSGVTAEIAFPLLDGESILERNTL